MALSRQQSSFRFTTYLHPGGNSVTLINFSVNKAGSFQAEEGMTWEQWVTSDYNTGGFYLDGDYVIVGDGRSQVSSVVKTDVITADYAYPVERM